MGATASRRALTEGTQATAAMSGQGLSASASGFTLLFSRFHVTTPGAFAAALVAAFALGLLHALAAQLARESGAALRGGGSRRAARRLTAGLLDAVAMLVLLLNVLLALSLNLWVLLAVALGHGIGFLAYDTVIPPSATGKACESLEPKQTTEQGVWEV